MPQVTSTPIAIAAAFALAAFLPLAGRYIARPWVWACLVFGAAGGFFAREAVKLVADGLAMLTGSVTGPVAVAVSLLIAACVAELLKALGPLLVIGAAQGDPNEGLSMGAAAGAGFGFVIVEQGLAMSLGLVGAPFITPASTIVAVAGWFFRILQQTVTTAYIGRAALGGGVGRAVLAMILLQFVLSLADRLPFIAGVPTGPGLAALVSGVFFIFLLRTRRPSPQGAETMWIERA